MTVEVVLRYSQITQEAPRTSFLAADWSDFSRIEPEDPVTFDSALTQYIEALSEAQLEENGRSELLQAVSRQSALEVEEIT